MTYRKGDVSTKWVSIILAVLVLVIYFMGGFGPIKKIIFGARQLPNFGFETEFGATLVGYDLEANQLQYFTGEKWEDIDSNVDSYTLGEHIFNPQIVLKTIKDFYLNSELRPQTLHLSVNSWSYVTAERSYKSEWLNIGLYEKKGINFGFKNYGRGYITRNNRFYEHTVDGFPSFLTVLNSKHDSPISKIMGWKDSILEGNSCEKFISLPLSSSTKKKSVENIPTLGAIIERDSSNNPNIHAEKKYTLRRIENYIFVDLDRPISDSKEEKWKNEACFEVEQYDDSLIDRSDWKNDAGLIINFRERLGVLTSDKTLSWLPSFNWHYPDKSIYDWKWKEYTFFEGLIILSKDFMSTSNNLHVYLSYQTTLKEIDLDNVLVANTPWLYFNTPRGLNEDENVRSNFVYTVVDEYNKYFLPPYYFVNDKGSLKLYTYDANKNPIYTNLFLKENKLYLFTNSLFAEPNVEVGSLIEGVFSVDLSLFLFEDKSRGAVSYLNNRKLNSFLIKEEI